MGTPSLAQEFAKQRSWNVANSERFEAEPQDHLSSPSGSQEGGNEPSCRAICAEFETIRPIPPGEAGGLPHEEIVAGNDGVTIAEEGAGTADLSRAQRGEAAASALPCLPNEHLNSLQIFRGGKTQRASAQRLILEVQSMVRKWGLEKIGMLTLGFKDPPPKTIKEASRRFNSFATNAKFSQRYLAWIAVIERSKTGRLHFHLVVVMPGDIRTGFSHEEIKNKNYSSAGKLLKVEWSFLRRAAPKYGFGDYVQLTPVKTNVDGFAGYLAKYLVKQFGSRCGDKGARLVRYSKGWKTVHGAFSWIGDRFRKVRAETRLQEMGKVLGFDGEYGAERIWGKRWKYHLARTLYCRTELYVNVVFYVQKSLESYDGIPFALTEAWAHFDALEKEWHRAERF